VCAPPGRSACPGRPVGPGPLQIAVTWASWHRHAHACDIRSGDSFFHLCLCIYKPGLLAVSNYRPLVSKLPHPSPKQHTPQPDLGRALWSEQSRPAKFTYPPQLGLYSVPIRLPSPTGTLQCPNSPTHYPPQLGLYSVPIRLPPTLPNICLGENTNCLGGKYISSYVKSLMHTSLAR